jgi:DNA replication protein DnaC
MNINFDAIMQGGNCINCGMVIEHFGVCDKCAEDFDRDRTVEVRREAIATIPGTLRWATFDAPELPVRVPHARAIERARKVANAIVAKKLLRVILVGPSGAGKSSLACAILRQVIEAGVGRSARFVGAVALGRARLDASLGSRPFLVDAAIRSSCLLLDDIGQEDPKGEHAIREVLHERFDKAIPQPLIVTTWLGCEMGQQWSQKGLQERYGEGTARRMLEHAVVVRVGCGDA